MKTPRFSILACLALGTPAAAQQLKVTGLTQAGNQITITIQDTGSSTSYRLDGSPSMAAGTWATVSATFSPVPGQAGFFRATINRPGAGKQFYRVVGSSGTTEDTDGDGLSNTFETSTFETNPGVFDTDGDGFSDGMEFAYGTTAVVGGQSSFPGQAGLPAIAFAASLSAVTEGTAMQVLTLQADRAFTGSVGYSVKSRSTAKSPADYSIAGSTAAPVTNPQMDDRRGTVAFNGMAATLTIQIVDDLIVSPDRQLIVEIDPPSAAPAPYRTGGRITHVVNLSDNDAYWNGVLKDADTERNFRLRLLQNASGRQAAFVAGTADGLPTADSGASSQSTGVIPAMTAAGATQEIWPATNITSTPTAFKFSSPAMPAASAGFIGQGMLLNRTLMLDSTFIVSADRLAGPFTEVVAPAIPSQTWLSRTNTGTFVLFRDLPKPPAGTTPLRP